MLRITERLQTPGKAGATLTLSFDQRQRSRQRIKLDSGEEAGLCLPHGSVLRAGDRLLSEDGRVVEVRALAEPVTTAYSDDPHLLARAAYHLGNRHIALEIGAGWVRYRVDHVLDAMVASLGLRTVREDHPFEPETGAYHGGGHRHPDEPGDGPHEQG
ncbi:MAG: urease accessory protein UreE [Gammaproteobacteria bacterium]